MLHPATVRNNRLGQPVSFEVNQDFISELTRMREVMGDHFPKIGILIVSYNAEKLIARTIERIPQILEPFLSEIFIFDDASPDETYEAALKVRQSSFWGDKLKVYRNPKNLGYGGNQKIGYRYAINKGLDYAIMVHGDGQYAPEYLPELIVAAIKERKDVVFGSRMINRKQALKGGMPLYKFVGNQTLTFFQNLALGTRLSEWHSGYRMYSTKILKQMPFEENTDDFHFDTQIIIQCRALNVKIHEIPIDTFYGEEDCHVNGMKYAVDVCLAVLAYRLHQLHIIRRSRYMVAEDCHYTRKNSPYSSHEKILSMINSEGKALDLGSSNGFLTVALRQKSVHSICVDILPRAQVDLPGIEYHQVDLEHPETLDIFEREFDYIILADVIEHLRNGPELIKRIQKYLKPNGSIIVSVPNIAIWIYRLSLLIGRFNYSTKGTLDETHLRFYTKATLKKLLERAGLNVKEIVPTGLPFEVVFESVGKSRFLKLMDSFYYGLTRIWPSFFAYQFVAKAEISALNAEEGEGRIV